MKKSQAAINTALLPKTWDELVLHKDTVFKTSNLRKHADQLFYTLVRKYLKREDLISIIKEMMHAEDMILLKCNFPYTQITENIPFVRHYILWSNRALDKNEIDKFLNIHIKSKPYIWYIQPLERKSIPELFHVHVFINEIAVN